MADEKKEVSSQDTNAQIVELLDRAIPQDREAKRAKRLAAHESNYRLHPDKVAVLEVSMSAIDKMDGTNGWYDVATGSDRSRELGLSTQVEQTKQRLIITDRFEVKFNRLPVEEWHHEYIIVDRKEWEDSLVAAPGVMLSDTTQLADIMMRRGA